MNLRLQPAVAIFDFKAAFVLAIAAHTAKGLVENVFMYVRTYVYAAIYLSQSAVTSIIVSSSAVLAIASGRQNRQNQASIFPEKEKVHVQVQVLGTSVYNNFLSRAVL